MRKIIKILILPIFTLILYSVFVNLTWAEVTPTVEFETTPLFSETNFVPGNSVNKWIKLNNTTDDTHLGIVRALNVVNKGNMGDATILQIKHGNETIYQGTFSDFFGKSEIVLSPVSASSSETFYFIVTFDKNSGNDTQNNTMSFNLQAGFEGDSKTDTISVGGSGSYTTVGPKALIITNDEAEDFLQDETNTIIITWDTNIPATSQVVYGLATLGPYNLDLLDPNFGYPSSTAEIDLDKVLNHAVIISGLPIGDYGYRVVSRASPPTIGYEKYFTIRDRQENQNQLALNSFQGGFSSESTSEQNFIQEEDNLIKQEPIVDKNNNLSASVGMTSNLSNAWFFGLIFFLVLLFIFFIIYRRQKK